MGRSSRTQTRRQAVVGLAALASLPITQSFQRVIAKELPPDPTTATASDMAAAIRERVISCVELVSAHLKRFEQFNQQLNAIVELNPKVLEEAENLDKLIDRNWGKIDFATMPLLGVPVTLKDNIETKGITTTDGSVGLRNYKPRENAQIVENLIEAGAFVLGKTNLPEAACFPCTDNRLHGLTRNPYALDRTVFGSSGGEAAAISACLSPIGVGTDMGGSVRLPAHACGIAALKETWRRIPTVGLLAIDPISIGRIYTNVIGPMARNVKDLALLYPVLASETHVDPYCSPVPIGNLLRPNWGDLRVAFFTDDGNVPASPETKACVDRAVSALEGLGAKIEERRPPGIDRTRELVFSAWGLDYAPEARRLLKETHNTSDSQTSRLMRQGLEMLENAGGSTSTLERQDISKRFLRFQEDLNRFMSKWDIVVSPIAAVPATKHENTNFDGIASIGLYTPWVNAGGLPAVALRCGTSEDGMPIGVQFVARRWNDVLALSVASQIEEYDWAGWKSPPVSEGQFRTRTG